MEALREKGPATAAASPFWKEIKEDTNKNLGMKGTWLLKDSSGYGEEVEDGTLNIDDGITYHQS